VLKENSQRGDTVKPRFCTKLQATKNAKTKAQQPKRKRWITLRPTLSNPKIKRKGKKYSRNNAQTL
jgi:hypothetical protein